MLLRDLSSLGVKLERFVKKSGKSGCQIQVRQTIVLSQDMIYDIYHTTIFLSFFVFQAIQASFVIELGQEGSHGPPYLREKTIKPIF